MSKITGPDRFISHVAVGLWWIPYTVLTAVSFVKYSLVLFVKVYEGEGLHSHR